MLTDLKFTYLAPDELRPDPRNPRTHSKKQVEQIAASMTELGFAGAIVINADRIIIAGHARYRAAKLLGLEQVPTITVSGLTPDQEKLLRIADNKLALNGGWDLDLLKIQIDEIQSVGLDVELTGYSVGEIDLLLSGPDDPDDDAVPAVPEAAVSRTGEIWLCGDHRIGCGNLLDSLSLETLMASEQADAVITDPPYNVKINGFANAKGRHAEFEMASGEMSEEQFVGFLDASLGACASVSRDGAVHFVFMDWRHIGDLIAVGQKHYDAMLNLCVWRKSNAGMGSLYRSQHELVGVFRVGTAQHFNAVELGRHGRTRTNVWEAASVNSFAGSRREDLDLHPTVKPTGLVAEAIRDVTRPGEIVLDGFLGSGTALVAAEQTGRRARGLEIAPAYVDVAISRWMTMTGKEAVLQGTGERFGERLAESRDAA